MALICSVLHVHSQVQYTNRMWTTPPHNYTNSEIVWKPFTIVTNPTFTTRTEVVTNWTTVSITEPVWTEKDFAQTIYRSRILNQMGTITTNTLAVIVWKGKTNETVLESSPCGERLFRSIGENPFKREP